MAWRGVLRTVLPIAGCSSTSRPRTARWTLVRERDGDGVAVHLVLLDEAQQPLSAGPGSVVAVTFAARGLGPDLRAVFADGPVVILR
jgi:hypothetical protein